MKKIFTTLVLLIGGVLCTHAQNTMNILLKNGSIVTAPLKSVKSVEYTTNGNATTGSVIDDVFAVESNVDILDASAIGSSFHLLTFTMSDRLKNCFVGLTSITLSNVKTGQSVDIPSAFISIDGMFYNNIGVSGFSSYLEMLTDYEPVAQQLLLTIWAQFNTGGIMFTKKASCTFSFMPYVSPEVIAERLFQRCYSNLGFVSSDKNAKEDKYDIFGVAANTTHIPRQLVNLNELTADELLCCWADAGISELIFNNWDTHTPQIEGMYRRLQKGVEYCNKYLALDNDNRQKKAEVRFLRAYYNANLLDLFGQVPVYKLADDVQPASMSASTLFNYLVSELEACIADLPAPHSRTSVDEDYGRIDQGAVWMLLARLYLNAGVYTGTEQWSKAAEWARKVVDSGAYSLHNATMNGWSAYQQLFMGDNGENGAAREAIMVVPYDGNTATDWGQLFFMAATQASDMQNNGADNGTDQYWLGVFARPDLVAKFFPNGNAPHANVTDMTAAAGDDRALFWGVNRSLDAENVNEFFSGYSIYKFNNRYATGGMPHNSQFADTDIFLMRYAETLLTLAEALLRMGNDSEAAIYINMVRARANAIQHKNYTLNDLLDEWAREFYMEGRRRTDLIRYGCYGGDSGYQWRWKGGNYDGSAIPVYRNLFPIPQTVIDENSNASQNPGY